MTFCFVMVCGLGDLFQSFRLLVFDGARTLVKLEDNRRCMIP